MKLRLLFLICISVLFYSCQFSKGIKKDLNTGLVASYNGFSIDDIVITDEDRNRLDNNKIALGTRLFIVATGVKNYEEKNGSVFPGCTIILTDKDKKQLLHLPDAFKDMTAGIPVGEAGTLQAQLNTGKPMFPGETYHLSVRFFDKLNKENEIVANVDLLATE